MRIGFTGHQGLASNISTLIDRAVLDLGGSLFVVIPARKYRDGFDDENARRGYDELIGKAERTQRLPYVESTELAHMSGGKAVVLACDLLVAVWDGQPARGYGGTGDVVAFARRRQVPVEVIWPEGATRN